VSSVIDVRDLRTHIVTRWGTIKAVDGVSFALGEAETLGLVGESGSGKSMTCLSLVRLVPRPAARIVGGEVRLDGEDLLAKSDAEMQQIRGRKVAMILQDPMSSLNPVFSIGMQMREPLAMYHGLRGAAVAARAAELLSAVRIPSPAARLRAFPHQLSGGMRQRVVGAMAIAGPPRGVGGYGGPYRGPPSQAGACSQQRVACPGAIAVSDGAVAHRSNAAGQRGANAQPAPSEARSGGWPAMAVSRSRRAPKRGIDSRSARV